MSITVQIIAAHNRSTTMVPAMSRSEESPLTTRRTNGRPRSGARQTPRPIGRHRVRSSVRPPLAPAPGSTNLRERERAWVGGVPSRGNPASHRPAARSRSGNGRVIKAVDLRLHGCPPARPPLDGLRAGPEAAADDAGVSE